MRARLTSGHFVGRVGELAELELAVREAAGGEARVVLVAGESGVGKTRLVGELERRVAGDSVLVLRGETVEQADGELPYAPLLGALRPLVRERHPTLEQLSAGSRRQLATLLPGLAEEGLPAAGGEDAAGQLRLFEALLELVDCLGATEPVVLALEDMHWADRSTRTFVAFLARSLRDERVVLLLTYRSDELHRRHPLRPLVAELERLERTRRVDVESFDRSELIEALADILGDSPSEALVERLFSRSEGNPLYTEELLAAGLDGRGAAPQTLRDAFMLRIERLPQPAQQAARAIAAGRRLDEPTIAEVTGFDLLELNAALRAAVDEQMLVAGADGRLMFRHALLREAVYDDLLPGERVELHLALARALDRCEATETDRELELATAVAGHYSAAGDQPAALRATVHAAQAARAVQAYGEAADLAERALDLWPRVPDAVQMFERLDHVGLLSLAAEAQALGGDRARAEVLLEAALRELQPEADPCRYSGLLARLARQQWSLNKGSEGVATAERALDLLPEGEVSGERAALLAWLARTRLLRGKFRDAITDGEEALSIAVAAGDRYSESEILNTLGMAQVGLRQVDEGVARLRRAIELTREIGDFDGLAAAYCNLADMLNLAGRTSDALDTAHEGLAELPQRMGRSRDYMVMTVSELAFEAGKWDVARAHLHPSPSSLIGRFMIFQQLRVAELALGEGEEQLAAAALDEAQPLVTASLEPQFHGVYGSLRAELCRRRRDLLGARAAVEAALDRLELCTDDVMRIARVTAIGTVVEADIAQRARDLRESGQLRDATARARIHMQRLRAASQEGGPVEQAWLAVGAAEAARGRGKQSPKLWAKAVACWEELQRPYPAAISRWHQAEALIDAGDRDGAGEAGAAALVTAERLGARWLCAELTALADRARLVLHGENGHRRAARADSAPDPFGLTARERQVLALLAEGATNRQIGQALFMAEKTASVHVSRILAKLDVHSRTQAAAVAHRLRLS